MSTPQKIRDDSPRSLTTGGSVHYASPSTAATNYNSPVDVRANVTDHLYQSLAGKLGELGLSNKSSSRSLSGPEDPFVTDSRHTNLSPTAADYQPGSRTSIAGLTHASIPEYPSSSTMRSADKSFSTSYSQFTPASFTGSAPSIAASLSPTRIRNSGSSRPENALGRSFTADMIPDGIASWSRYIALKGVDPEDADDRNTAGPLSRFRESGCMMGVRNVKKSSDGLTLIFCYDSLDEAIGAYHAGNDALRSQDYPQTWKLGFLAEDAIKDKQRSHEAEVLVTVSSNYSQSMRSDLVSLALDEINKVGHVHAVELLPSTPLAMRIEMSAISAAESLVRLRGRTSPKKSYENFQLDIEFWADGYDTAVVSQRSYGQMPMTPGALTPCAYSSPQRALPMSTVVIPEKIRTGDDVRTTVMIRNIPNKVDAAQFKNILDAHVFGKYDFSYLRIDFQNLCNVGYAFVNFTKAEDIVPLFEAIVGRHWNIYNSDKVAEMCYATIQGLDCCIEKFRNSSVMLEWQPHRPKLWYTENDGELAGLEKDFPPPTNYQKLQRSKDNAAEVGLYPPRGVSAYRHDGRQHQSMLDRGNPKAVDYHLMARGMLTYPPHLMGGAMGPALSPVTPPFNAHTFGQPSPISPFLPHGHQMYAPSMMPHSPATAMFHGGGLQLPAHLTGPYMAHMMAQAQAQAANQHRN
ncbi:Protein transport protein SEC61 subunit alpha [Venturia nashicola]|uniref:Protein transport protein SEC61 subunit alpha n=1 Tax=Venturia nashicola TaxID=86259 RepID=A0A4Z1NXK3_9PEZI|nr:Protein transport protein SEC61 subunit alpha [Venturia nashicola]TLD23678.1 Protein transport protein SEC61 subunit alpha [Venturia nashicola]